MTGKLFDMAHGHARGAIGVEWREAKIDDTPSINMQTANVYNLTRPRPTRGKDSVKERLRRGGAAAAERPHGRRRADLNLSGRWTDYKSYGSDRRTRSA